MQFDLPQAEHPFLPGAEPFIYPAGEVACLFVHGFTSSAYEMREPARYLADRGITAGACLLAGHGSAPEDLRGKTWQDWYASVTTAIDLLRANYKHVYLAGLSLGGALTLYAASQYGDKLAGIIVMSAPVYVPSGVAHLLRGIQGPLPFITKPYRDIEDQSARDKHVGYVRSPVDATASLVDFLAQVRGGLPNIQIPSLVIYSRHDHVVPSVSSHYIYSQLGSIDKQLLALHRGFHIVTVDYDKAKVFEAIYKFICQQEDGNVLISHR
ncbi:MAG: alpha/beta fold hydrolase [Chloroflexia bacterium]